LKAGSVRSAFDDVDGPIAEFGEGLTQVGAVVDAVGEEMAQPGKQLMDGLDDEAGTIAILDIGGCTSAPTSRPQVSVTMWRLRALTFLAVSRVEPAVGSADRLSRNTSQKNARVELKLRIAYL
jgi:hypothetical protein